MSMRSEDEVLAKVYRELNHQSYNESNVEELETTNFREYIFFVLSSLVYWSDNKVILLLDNFNYATRLCHD